jgi:thioredoxin 1
MINVISKMRMTIFLSIIIIGFSSCKKDLVDASKNNITDVQSLETFKSEIKEGTSVVFYFAAWCSVCEEFRPTFESVEQNVDLSLTRFLEVEYDENRDVFEDQGVNSFPQLLIYVDGLEQERLIGKNHTESEVVNTIKKYL